MIALLPCLAASARGLSHKLLRRFGSGHRLSRVVQRGARLLRLRRLLVRNHNIVEADLNVNQQITPIEGCLPLHSL